MTTVHASRAKGLLAAFADPVRLRLLNLLHDGETCVGDLVAVIRLPQPTVSRHLAVLRRAGLVSARRQGLWMFYSLQRAEGAVHARLLSCLACCADEVPELEQDLRRSRKRREAGGCCPLHEGEACGPVRRGQARRRAARCGC